MKGTILLTGGTGQVGYELRKRLPHLGELVAPVRTELDLSDEQAVRRAVQELRPGLIVNAAAYTAVDRAEAEPAAAQAVNAAAPGWLAEEAKKIGAALIHYSTDYVFDGTQSSPYEESNSANPLSTYGRTKYAGEQAIRSSGAAHLILRTAWVYATRGRNFLLTILRLATQRQELRVVDDQRGAPTWSGMIAAATCRILEGVSSGGVDFSRLTAVSGTYHLSASGETSWCGFARAILEECGGRAGMPAWLAEATSRQPLVAERVVPIATSEYPTAARRPAYSVLCDRRLRETFGIELVDWRTQLHMAVHEVLPETVLGRHG